ncbi:organic cation/carnitine transporter 2-like isoform X2 [Phyllopteryx taeniolatus]|uniref:organic cation/carnitine transporter 2-like isoform X2 n=1 Tax=Phyllopteryx taeniolatus TaxID=161469 RepID=UPI002AD4CFC5|nr:organic cation/carnitine transporter 2-like isoform X2 [Phyllopteryx taeniolatus]
MQNYEDSVSFLGSWGPFQRRVIFQLCLAAIPSGYNILSSLYLLAVPPHTCRIPTGNLSQEWTEAAIPQQLVAGQVEQSSCSRFQLSLIQNLSTLNLNLSTLGTTWNQRLSPLGSGSGPLLSSLKQEDCKDGWTFSTEHYQSTVVTEFNLVCEDQWKPPLSTLAYFLGGLCGCFISGQLSDRFGRKPVLLSSIALLSIFSSVLALAPSWELFTVLFFIAGLGQISCYVVVFVLGSEILTGPTRVLFSNLCLPFAYVFGMLLLPGTAYLVRNWRPLALILALPGLACVPLWWLLPESPRWLVSHGRLRQAEVLLSSAALENCVGAPEVIFKTNKVGNQSLNQSESLNFVDLVQTRNVRHMSLILWIIWFSLNLSSFGVSFNMSSLPGNPFVNYFLVLAIEVPAYTAGWLATRRLPRRLSFIAFSVLGALALLLVQITLQGVWYELLPWILVGSLSVFGVVLSIFLPETFTHPLPDTIQQMATMRKWPCSSSTADRDRKPPEDQTTGPQVIWTAHF